MDSDQLAETVMDTTKRTLKQVTLEDFARADLTVSNLMGSSVPPRKKFLQENGHRANVQI